MKVKDIVYEMCKSTIEYIYKHFGIEKNYVEELLDKLYKCNNINCIIEIIKKEIDKNSNDIIKVSLILDTLTFLNSIHFNVEEKVEINLKDFKLIDSIIMFEYFANEVFSSLASFSNKNDAIDIMFIMLTRHIIIKLLSYIVTRQELESSINEIPTILKVLYNHLEGILTTLNNYLFELFQSILEKKRQMSEHYII